MEKRAPQSQTVWNDRKIITQRKRNRGREGEVPTRLTNQEEADTRELVRYFLAARLRFVFPRSAASLDGGMEQSAAVGSALAISSPCWRRGERAETSSRPRANREASQRAHCARWPLEPYMKAAHASLSPREKGKTNTARLSLIKLCVPRSKKKAERKKRGEERTGSCREGPRPPVCLVSAAGSSFVLVL